MKEIIIGSTAMKHWFPKFPREPKDLDIAVKEKRENKPGVEYLYNPILFDYQGEGYLNPDLLYTLKRSHLRWDINWDKHMFDFQWLKSQGCVINSDLLFDLEDFWKDYLPKVRRSNLSLSKEEFFTNAVNEDTNQHDFLHTVIADIPAYTLILKDGSEVEPDPEKWFHASDEVKRAVVVEEAFVMGIMENRYPNAYSPFSAYRMQLRENIIKHYPDFVADWAINMYPELLKPPFEYLKKLKEWKLKK